MKILTKKKDAEILHHRAIGQLNILNLPLAIWQAPSGVSAGHLEISNAAYPEATA